MNGSGVEQWRDCDKEYHGGKVHGSNQHCYVSTLFISHFFSIASQRPGFVSSPQPEQELNDLLRLCASPPSLELLSSPDAMDVGNASVSFS